MKYSEDVRKTFEGVLKINELQVMNFMSKSSTVDQL